MPRLAKLRALTALERGILLQSLFLLPLTSASLRFAGLARTRRWLDRLVPRGPAREGLDASRVARVVAIASRHGPIRPRCLSAALALRSLLRRHGMDASLRLGVRKHEGRLEAHAWVEHAGHALMEPAGVHDRFTAFDGGSPGR
jgi:hypothetical protein